MEAAGAGGAVLTGEAGAGGRVLEGLLGGGAVAEGAAARAAASAIICSTPKA
jgi:hypothetical protein